MEENNSECTISFPIHHAIIFNSPHSSFAKLTSFMTCPHIASLLRNAELGKNFPHFMCLLVSHLSHPPSKLKCQVIYESEPLCVILLSRHAFDTMLNVDLAVLSKLHKQPIEKIPTVFLPPCLGIFDVDFAGFRLISGLLTRYMILQEAISWLSTLGGGFSSLGDKFQDAAEIAGAISQRQLKLARTMQIPAFQARCYLFYAQSLMQQGHLRTSAAIIRFIHKFSKKASTFDNPPEVHLSQMCEGMWNRLQYLWRVRRVKHKPQHRRINLTNDEMKGLLETNSNVYDGTAAERLFPDVSIILKAL